MRAIPHWFKDRLGYSSIGHNQQPGVLRYKK